VASVLPLPDGTSGGPHWGALDNFVKSPAGGYTETNAPSRLAASNDFVARTGVDGNHKLCMVNIGPGGKMSIDTNFRDENEARRASTSTARNGPRARLARPSRTRSCSSWRTTACISRVLRRTAGVVVASAVLLPASPAVAHQLHPTAPASWPDLLGRSAAGAVLLLATLPLAGLLVSPFWAGAGPNPWRRQLAVAACAGVAVVADLAGGRLGAVSGLVRLDDS
jgi:hypothetical protein